jgi:uncharacterized protein YjeT (DUF2065 family)
MPDYLTAPAPGRESARLFLATFPQRLRQIVAMRAATPPDTLRIGGLAVAALGVFLVWLLRG